MHLCDDDKAVSGELRIAKIQSNDAYLAVMEYTLGYLRRRSKEQCEIGA